MASRWMLTALVFAATIVIGSLTIGWQLAILIPLGIVLAAVAAVSDSAARQDDVNSTGLLGSTASIIQAGGLVLGVWAIWYYVDNPLQAFISNIWIIPLGIVGLFGYWYLQHRRQVASASTAIDRTKRTASRTVSSWTELATGIFLLAVTFVFAFAEGFVDAFAPYMGELGYLTTVGLGYISLGGEAGGPIASIIPELNPVQWIGVTLFIGGAALYIQRQS